MSVIPVYVPSLLPCPFCGKAPKLWERDVSDNSTRKETAIACWTDDCPGGESAHVFPSKAIERWNRRAEMKPIQEL